MSDPTGFKRINFFKGFLTTEKDWNEAEKYHIDKRSLHAKMLHSREEYVDDHDPARRRHLLRLWLAAKAFSSVEDRLRAGIPVRG